METEKIVGPLGQQPTGIEAPNFMVNPLIFELKCRDCQKVCGTLAWPANTPIDLKKIEADHVTVCDDCAKK